MKFRSGIETNPQKLENREKQILFGKNTTGYDNYISAVPRCDAVVVFLFLFCCSLTVVCFCRWCFRHKRLRIPEHPRTPDINVERSKRGFEGLVNAWRRQLHRWDNPDIRPDVNPEAVKLKPKAEKDAAFEDSNHVGHKRKLANDADELNNDPNKISVREILKTTDDVETKFTTGEEEQVDGNQHEELLQEDDGYVSEDVL
jgi:hypothetical protein